MSQTRGCAEAERRCRSMSECDKRVMLSMAARIKMSLDDDGRLSLIVPALSIVVSVGRRAEPTSSVCVKGGAGSDRPTR